MVELEALSLWVASSILLLAAEVNHRFVMASRMLLGGGETDQSLLCIWTIFVSVLFLFHVEYCFVCRAPRISG